uniref:Protein phosphatase methylesterase 1 n=2 Tax=Mesocestoides corti TaxID=53468 RepID=A0A5K3EHK4_MESCO
TYRIYRRGVEGPLLFFIHGGGFSALSWSLLSKAITDDVRCQCLAVDMRGHGDTRCSDEDDYSIETLSNDIIQIIFAMFPTEAPPIILIGHSMGGAVAVHVAQKRAIPSFAGLVVIDVVEGTALESLYSMTSFLRSRPQGFRSLADGIAWCVRSGQIRNVESACISFPGQLKRVATGESATMELDKGTALIDVSELNLSGNLPENSSRQFFTALANTSPTLTSATSMISEEGEEEDDEAMAASDAHVVESGNGELTLPSNLSGTALSDEVAESLESNQVPPPPHTNSQLPPMPISGSTDAPKSSSSAEAAEHLLTPGGHGAYTWRIDLSKTEPFWRGWFSNMSSLFLSVPEPKLLLVAGVDRLDKELTIAQMQGKFQLKILPRAGHAIHEDSPDEVASCLAQFLLRNQFTGAKPKQ